MHESEMEIVCDCADGHDDIISFLTHIVDQTYSYRDKYFENHSIELAINKDKDVKALLSENIQIFNKHEKMALQKNKAYYHYLKGRLLNVYSTYSKEAEQFLSKAIKLNPKLVEAWNELGECYCKNDDLIKAKSCFEGALKGQRNKVSLRNLSIVLRQENCKSQEKVKNIEQGLNYAKEAVQLDPHDGVSWAILGNANLSYFFGVHQNPNTLRQCLSAYLQAEKDIVAKSTSDLHYNKGITFKYQEEFEKALHSFKEASLYDPLWDVPKSKEEHLVAYLQEIQDLVAAKGKLKPKKLQQILDSIDLKHLGPYGGGSYTSANGAKANLAYIPYDHLKSGLNIEVVILGKVICSVRNEEAVPFTFCSIDQAGTVIVCTVFNLADGKGVIIGDSVAIPEPFVTDIDFTYKDNKFAFRLVRIETPVIMVVNSKKLGRNLQAGVQMSASRKFD